MSTPAPPVAGVVFDLDGTLLQRSGDNLHSMAAAANDLLGTSTRLEMIDEVPHVNGDPKPGWVDAQFLEHMAHLAGRSLAEVQDDLVAAYGERYRRDVAAGMSPGARIPGVNDMLGALRANGLPVAMATGNVHSVARIKMAAVGLADHFTFAKGLGFGDTLTSRAAIGAAALAGLGAVEQAYIVGDTISDMQSAAANGARGIGVLTGAATSTQLWGAGAFAVLRSAADLPRLMYLPA